MYRIVTGLIHDFPDVLLLLRIFNKHLVQIDRKDKLPVCHVNFRWEVAASVSASFSQYKWAWRTWGCCSRPWACRFQKIHGRVPWSDCLISHQMLPVEKRFWHPLFPSDDQFSRFWVPGRQWEDGVGRHWRPFVTRQQTIDQGESIELTIFHPKTKTKTWGLEGDRWRNLFLWGKDIT